MAPETQVIDRARAGPPFAVGVLAVLGTLPLVVAETPLMALPRWLSLVLALCVGVVAVGLATAVGAMLAPDVGLETLRHTAFPAEGVHLYRLPALAGVGVALFTLGLGALSGAESSLSLGSAGDSLGVVGVVAGSVLTELLLRFGLMTLVVWLAWTRRPALDRGVTRSGGWSGVLAAALVGSVLTVAVAVVGGAEPVTAFVTGVGPLVGGVVFGLLYWRYDLAAAVVAHGVASLLRAVVVALV